MARNKFARYLECSLNPGSQAKLPSIQSLLKAHSGPCVVQFSYANSRAKANLSLAKQWHVTPSDELLHLLANLLGEEQALMRY